MCHYQVMLIHQFVDVHNPEVGMVIECDAPSPVDAADILFTVATPIVRSITGVEILVPLTGRTMTVGDRARVIDPGGHPTELACLIDGWGYTAAA